MSNVKEDALKLLDFIKAFNELKFKTRLNINDLKKTYLQNIPAVDDYVRIGVKYKDCLPERDYPVEEKDDVIISVRYASPQQPPEIPKILNGWLSYDVNHFEEQPSHYDSKNKSEDSSAVEMFDDSSMRVSSYEGYIKKWTAWQAEEKERERVRKIYFELREMQRDIESGEASNELVVGNGILTQAGDELFYPIITQEIKIYLDTQKNKVIICNSGAESKVETRALQQLQNIENIDISKTGLYDIHPMEGKRLYDILKSSAIRLSIRQTIGVRQSFEEKLPEKKILFTLQPVFFIRPRVRAVGRLVDDLKKHIQDGSIKVNDFLIQALSDVVSEDENDGEKELSLEEILGRSCGESKDVLFTKPANKEQLEIAEKVETNGVVVVQGPPGTGKTHTIANLIGHFLSEGKTVLVTSEKVKALSVLRNQVEKQLQPLCIYLNGGNKDEAVQSVRHIQEYKTSHNISSVKRSIENYKSERSRLIDKIAQIRRNIYQIRNKQVASIVYDGKAYSPIDAAQFVKANTGTLSYIPGNVKEFNAFPLSNEDLQFLYTTNETVSVEDELSFTNGHPEIEKIPAPELFTKIIDNRQKCKEKIKEFEGILKNNLIWDNENSQITDKNGKILLAHADNNAINELKQLLDNGYNESLTPWKEQVILDSIKGEAYQRLWKALAEIIENTQKYYEDYCVGASKKNIQIEESFFSMEDHIRLLRAAVDKMDEQGKFSFWNNLFGNKYKAVCACFSIQGHPVQSKLEGNEVLVWANFIEMARNAGNLWDQMMKDDPSVPSFEDLIKQSSNPLEPMKKALPDIQKGLNYHDRYEKLMELLPKAGFIVKNVVNYGQWDDNDTSIRHEIQFLQNELPIYLECYYLYQTIEYINRNLYQYQTYLSSVSAANKAWRSFYSFFREEKIEKYREEYAELIKLIKKESDYLRRKEILQALQELAPGWSKSIKSRKGILGGTQIPETIYDAWKWKQLDRKIKEINKFTLDQLEKDLADASLELMKRTIQLCEAKAWYSVCSRINKNPALEKAMASWQQAINKLGKGTSKYAPVYKQMVQEAMKECQKAIPVWIMPFYMTYDFLQAGDNHFDIIIVDEASQSDVTSLATLQLADKVIVVGDDKQVSPTNMRISGDEIDRLRKMCLGKEFPKYIYQVMDAESSLYDFASLQSQRIMLIEHFRCVPEIIGYSNYLSYSGQIKALRPADSTALRPSIVSCFVDGKRDKKGKINKKEADYIVALIQACCNHPAYKNQTMGVISLLGNEQAEVINQLIAEKINLEDQEEHQIICGDAAQFQGDERDIIFLSMVDSSEEGPLRFRAMDHRVYQQRYNVAVSRAKNQIWIVHSLHKETDLKIQDGKYDIRRSLLEYADNPHAFVKDQDIENNADSPFEAEVCQYLSAYGFSYTQQYPVGSYYLDIAMNGTKVAIECDGDRWHSTEEQIANDMERQAILERLGWKFIRIRGTQYYSNKAETMKWVQSRLKDFHVLPSGVKPVVEADVVTETIKTEAEKWLEGNYNPVRPAKVEKKEDGRPYENRKYPQEKKDARGKTVALRLGESYGPSLFDKPDIPMTSGPSVNKGSSVEKHKGKPVFQGSIDVKSTTKKRDVPKKKPIYEGVIEIKKDRRKRSKTRT